MLTKYKVISLVAVPAVALVAFVAPALAQGSWHPISGTCYEDGGWYTSSNVRYVSSGGAYFKVNFNRTPQKGIAFRVLNYNTGLQMGSTVYAPPINTTLQMTTATRPGGTPFVNSFKLQVSGHQDNYDFDGSEWY
jgi:hypothetical protein